MKQLSVDVVVIGSGPGGQKAAIQAAKLGKEVLIIEKWSNPGGACLNTGTIPSKTLREAILDLTGFHQRSFYGKENEEAEISISDLNYRLDKVLEQQRRVISRQFRKNNIRFVVGSAFFVSPNEIGVVNKEENQEYRIKADKIFISTGSKPRNPINVPFDKQVILDSTRLLRIEKVPKEMIVLGGGIIGSEYASFFAALGTEVTVVDKKEHMLPLLDSEIGIHLQTDLADIGLKFLGNAEPESISREGDRAIVKLKDGRVVEGDVLLYALGRVANVDFLEIDKAGLALNEWGFLGVNEWFQTEVPHIYGIGDVIGPPALASTSMEQGRLAARHALGEEVHVFPTFFPVGIYTIPEISTCGLTEDQLQKEETPYEVGRAYYYEIARGHISGSKSGMFKILFHRETLEILGVHIIGRGATEVIHIGQVAMSFKASIGYFIDQVFNYPTFAEGYRVAALNGFNKLKDSPGSKNLGAVYGDH
jgi:NAD(P) transhydrogenase